MKGLKCTFYFLPLLRKIINIVYLLRVEHLFLHNESVHQPHEDRKDKKSELGIIQLQSLKVQDFRLELE
jgi:hypothetical protein